MQHLNSLLPNALQSTLPSTTVEKSPLATRATETLWLRLGEIYGHKWTSAYGDKATGSAAQTWAKGLGGLTALQVADGLKSCLANPDPWPPTLPEFRARCLGIPPLAAVRLDSTKIEPFTRLVWQYLNTYRYRNASADLADKLLREAYELAREHVMRGGDLPEPAVAEIEHKPAPKPQIPETREEREARLRLLLGDDLKLDDEQ